MTDPVDLRYLNSLYAASSDPWQLSDGWYERRKRDLVLASLLRAHYTTAFEPGCSTGELTVRLADRVDTLLAADYHAEAVRTARRRTANLAQVEVRQLLLPEQWPMEQEFDLIVLSEIGYFFRPEAWSRLCQLTANSTGPDSTVIACHWRHDFPERRLATSVLHELLAEALVRPCRTHLLDEDFLIDVWGGSGGSIASTEGKT